MYVRKKYNHSGTISMVVVDKSNGAYKEIHTVGIAACEADVAELMKSGRNWIARFGGQQLLDLEGKAEREVVQTEEVLSNISSARLTATQKIIGKVYDMARRIDHRKNLFSHVIRLLHIVERNRQLPAVVSNPIPTLRLKAHDVFLFPCVTRITQSF